MSKKELYEGLKLQVDTCFAGYVAVIVMCKIDYRSSHSIFYQRVYYGRSFRKKLAAELKRARKFTAKEAKYKRLLRGKK